MQWRRSGRLHLRALSLTTSLLAALAAGCTTGQMTGAVAPVAPGAVQVYAAGDLADCRFDAPERAAANRTAALVPPGATVLAPGDLAYPLADAATLRRCFAATWGQHREQMLVAVGNHDYVHGNARAVREFFPQAASAVSTDFFAYATQPAAGWWLVVLDSNVAGESMQRQVAWLEQALTHLREATDAGASCLAVMWHAPLYSSGLHRGSGEHMRPLWALVDRFGADIVLSGHEHFYERFRPLDADGNRVSDAQAPRQFVVGTGGAVLYGFWRPPYRSESRVRRHGVLQLSLAPGEYGWSFIDVDRRVRDAGAARCRGVLKSGNVPATAATPIADQ